MIKFYRAQRDAQIQWIQENPAKYIAVNAILLVALFGYYEIKDRRQMREMLETIESTSEKE